MKGLLFLIASVALVLASSENGKVTLQDGSTRYKGRVEITLDGESSPRQVCTTDFESGDTEALCAAAGFQHSSGSIAEYGVKGGLEFVKVKCTDETCEYTPEQDHYTCADRVLGLDCSPSLGTTGSIGLEAGIIAGIIVCLVAVIGIGLGLGVCLYRNDLIPCCQNSATA